MKKICFILSFLLIVLPQGEAFAMSCKSLYSEKKVLPEEVKIAEQAEKMTELKVAAVQYALAENITPDQFFKKLETHIDVAKTGGAQLVVFPELITTELVDWGKPDIPQLKKIAEEFAPKYVEWLKNKAVKNNIAILGGTTPRKVGAEIINTAILALPDGKIILQDKIFLTPDEKAWGWTAGNKLKVVDTPWGKTAITICFDCEFPVISNMLANERPEVILVPSWTSTENGLNRVDWTAKARAIEHYAYVIKTGTVPDKTSTQPHYGKASIIGPQDGAFPLNGIEGVLNSAEIVYGKLDLTLLRTQREKSGYYPGKEQNNRQAPIELEN